MRKTIEVFSIWIISLVTCLLFFAAGLALLLWYYPEYYSGIKMGEKYWNGWFVGCILMAIMLIFRKSRPSRVKKFTFFPAYLTVSMSTFALIAAFVIPPLVASD